MDFNTFSPFEFPRVILTTTLTKFFVKVKSYALRAALDAGK